VRSDTERERDRLENRELKKKVEEQMPERKRCPFAMTTLICKKSDQSPKEVGSIAEGKGTEKKETSNTEIQTGS